MADRTVPRTVPSADDLWPHPPPSAADIDAVTSLLGRPTGGRFTVVVRDAAGGPVVIRNRPLMDDGRPMPTLYWLLGRAERAAVGRLESEGGVAAAEAAVDPVELAAAHARYAAERDRLIPPGHQGPRPSGGVGGTRRGVKCLHAHYAWYLTGADDPVGLWVARQLPSRDKAEILIGTRDFGLFRSGRGLVRC